MIRNSSWKILNVGAPNRRIQGSCYLWEKLGRERIVQIDALSHYGMYTRFHLARSQPRHLLPASRLPASISSPQANLATLLDSLHLAQHVLEMFRRTFPQGPDRRLLDRLANRLTKVASEAGKLAQG